MVAAEDVVVDAGILHGLLELLGDHEVVEPPADVFGPAACPHGPPGVLDFLGVDVPEGVDPSVLQELGEAIPFLLGEACRLFVAFGPGNIDLFVADIEVSAQDDRLLLPQNFKILPEGNIPLLYPVIQPVQFLACVGNVRSR